MNKLVGSESKYASLEKKRSWRIAKVSYWLVIIFAIMLSVFYQDYYGHYTLQGLALILVLVCYPLYLLYKKVAFYILSGE